MQWNNRGKQIILHNDQFEMNSYAIRIICDQADEQRNAMNTTIQQNTL